MDNTECWAEEEGTEEHSVRGLTSGYWVLSTPASPYRMVLALASSASGMCAPSSRGLHSSTKHLLRNA
jgi:hypothetical protein